MKNICFYFQVHQAFRIKKLPVFQHREVHYYYDDYGQTRKLFITAKVCRKKSYFGLNKTKVKWLGFNLIAHGGKGFKIWGTPLNSGVFFLGPSWEF